MLDGTSSAPAQQVNVTGIDPFAKYHSDIQGKKKGRLTFVGMLGILLGVGFICLGVALLPKGDGEAGFMTMLLGIGIALACYLWARAPKKHNK